MVSLAPSATEIVYALECGDRLVARTAFCDYPQRAQMLPSVGGWTTANVDAVVAFQPDLVLTSTFLQDRIAAALRTRSVTICHMDPRTLPEVLESFTTVASILGVPERGKELCVRVASTLASHRPPSDSSHPRVYAEEWPDPPMTSGNWVPGLIALAGGQSFLPSGERSRTVSLEEVQAFDPDMILLNYCGMGKIPAASQMSRLLSRSGWDTLRALRTRRVFVLPDSLLNRPGPRLVEGIRELARVLTAVRAAL